LKKLFRNAGFYLVLIVIAVTAINRLDREDTEIEKLSYTQFTNQVAAKQVRTVLITGGNAISGKLKDGTDFVSYNPGDESIYALLRDNNVDVNGQPPPQPAWWVTLITSSLPIIILIVFWVFMMQQMQGGGSRMMSFGKSKAKLQADDKNKVTFADVAGVDEAKQELEEIVDFLKRPKQYMELGARIPKGVLLVGSPGTGKTLLAKAIAGEAGVPFFSISGSHFVEMFVGVGASRVRDLFEQGKRNSPCIIFIDEIDAVGRQRGAGLGGGHDEREQTLNQLLVEMDGFGVNEGIILIAATNRPDVLDPALLRPGRFDRQVVVDRPDVVGRVAILKVHTKGKPLDKDVDLEVLSRRTPGFTGADLSNLVNEAALLSARNKKKKISMDSLEQSIDRVIAGPERKSKVISEKEKGIVAYHEGGHALVAKMLPDTDPVHKISVIPRGAALGYVLQLPMEDRYLVTKTHLLNEITVMLGGRVSEALVFNEISSGAQNDLERVTATARRMVMEYGMSEELGPVVLGHKQDAVFLGRDLARDRNYSEEVANKIDVEVRRIIDECYAHARQILTDHRDKLELIATTLLEREVIEGRELEILLDGENADAAQDFIDEVNKRVSSREEAISGDEKNAEDQASTDSVSEENEPALDATKTTDDAPGSDVGEVEDDNDDDNDPNNTLRRRRRN